MILFSEPNLEVFQSKDVEARNYCLYSKGEKEDEFTKSKAHVNKFKDNLKILERKNGKNYLFYSISYAIHYIKTIVTMINWRVSIWRIWRVS